MGNSFFSRAGVDVKVKLRELSYPIVLSLALTERCNMSCSFCAVSCSSDSILTHEDIYKDLCMKIMTEAKKNCVQEIVFTGGEPLLYNEEDLFEILDHGKNIIMDMSLITNGSLLTPRMIEKLKGYIKKINISIHGSELMHNNITGIKIYNRVIEAVEYIKYKTDIRVSLLYTLTKLNNSMLELEHVIDISKKLNIPLYISRGNDVGTCRENSIYPSLEDVNKFARRMIQHRKEGFFIEFANSVPKCILDEEVKSLSKACSSGVGYCSIDSTGKVKVCSQSDKHIGEIDHSGHLGEVWRGQACNKYRSLINLNPICKSCESLSSCKGGCKLEEYDGYCIDRMLVQKVEHVWEKHKSKQVKIKGRAVKEEKDKLLVYTLPAIICSKNYLDILLLLNKRKGVKIDELLNTEKALISEFEIKMFIYYLVQKEMLYFLKG
ncbi:radical SAM protein [Clostridiaceae bacterium M8S5]|nr:radical SAM protein [Clostridiaceae bacterium M8S5]